MRSSALPSPLSLLLLLRICVVGAQSQCWSHNEEAADFEPWVSASIAGATFQDYKWSAQASGCAYADADKFYWEDISHRDHPQSMGPMTWLQCMREASKRGASVMPTFATKAIQTGWYGHRNGNNAMTGVWNYYREKSTASLENCVLGRDGRSNTVRSRYDAPWVTTNDPGEQLRKTVIINGEPTTWVYKDFGLKYADECQLLASTHGASQITPFTIDEDCTQPDANNIRRCNSRSSAVSSSGYWVQSIHMCSVWNWFTAPDQLEMYPAGNGNQWVQKYCMIGYLECTESPPPPPPTPPPEAPVAVPQTGGSTT